MSADSNASTRWLSAEAFAQVHGLSRRAATRALSLAARGQPWRGETLKVRRRHGRGGRGGVRYEALQEDPGVECIAEHVTPPVGALGQEARVEARFDSIFSALIFPRGTPERASALSAAADAARREPRTLYRWLGRYERYGLAGLANTRPCNAGQPRVVVSREFDRAVRRLGAPDGVLRAISDELDRKLKGLWASRAEAAGWREIRNLAQFVLKEACETRGLALPPDALQLSRRRIEAFAHFRVVNQRKNDRKAFDDAKPRIRRDWTAVPPMDRVVADVKHLDVIVRRPDGSLAWPKIVAFLDAGTNRVFVHPVLLDRGEGVRQEHVIEAFLAMAADAEWGFPAGLYLDNGVEFAAFLKIQGALSAINEPGARTIIFARPYNASAKPIESMFARLDRYVFSLLPGYAGPDRMDKKTQRVGKNPEPFPGDWETFCATVKELIGAHNQQPIGGAWEDRSPAAWLAVKRAGGWRPATVDPVALDAAFCDHDSRRVDRGVLKIRGDRFHHPAVSALPGRTALDIALPWRRGAAPLARVPHVGWVRLQPDPPFPAQWLEGARESDRRQKAQRQYVAGLAREAPKLDPIELKIRAAAQPTLEREARPIRPTLDLGAQTGELARALRQTTPAKADALSSAERRRRREMAVTERLEQRLRSDDV